MVKDVTPTSSTLNDEQQSMEALRHYGGYIIMTMALALGGYFGWNYYQNHGGRIDTAAANDFAKLQADQNAISNLSQDLTATNNPQLTAANATLDKDLDSYIAQHGDSVYTWQALMLKAKQQMQANNNKGAVATLQKASSLKFGDVGLEAIANLRYAQALLANNQADEAQKVLQVSMPPAFDASKEELLGDIAMSKNDKNAAISHYQKAWQVIEARNKQNHTQQDRAMLRLKMQELGLNPKLPEDESVISQAPQTQTIQNNASAVASTASTPSASATSTSKKSEYSNTAPAKQHDSSESQSDNQKDKTKDTIKATNTEKHDVKKANSSKKEADKTN